MAFAITPRAAHGHPWLLTGCRLAYVRLTLVSANLKPTPICGHLWQKSPLLPIYVVPLYVAQTGDFAPFQSYMGVSRILPESKASISHHKDTTGGLWLQGSADQNFQIWESTMIILRQARSRKRVMCSGRSYIIEGRQFSHSN